MTRQFSIVSDSSILFGETTLQWSLEYDDMFRIRYGRNLVTFNEVNVSILDLLYEFDLTEDEEDQIRDYLWKYFFLVSQSR